LKAPPNWAAGGVKTASSLIWDILEEIAQRGQPCVDKSFREAAMTELRNSDSAASLFVFM